MINNKAVLMCDVRKAWYEYQQEFTLNFAEMAWV